MDAYNGCSRCSFSMHIKLICGFEMIGGIKSTRQFDVDVFVVSGQEMKGRDVVTAKLVLLLLSELLHLQGLLLIYFNSTNLTCFYPCTFSCFPVIEILFVTFFSSYIRLLANSLSSSVFAMQPQAQPSLPTPKAPVAARATKKRRVTVRKPNPLGFLSTLNDSAADLQLNRQQNQNFTGKPRWHRKLGK